jgi:hypothetical protein
MFFVRITLTIISMSATLESESAPEQAVACFLSFAVMPCLVVLRGSFSGTVAEVGLDCLAVTSNISNHFLHSHNIPRSVAIRSVPPQCLPNMSPPPRTRLTPFLFPLQKRKQKS